MLSVSCPTPSRLVFWPQSTAGGVSAGCFQSRRCCDATEYSVPRCQVNRKPRIKIASLGTPTFPTFFVSAGACSGRACVVTQGCFFFFATVNIYAVRGKSLLQY